MQGRTVAWDKEAAVKEKSHWGYILIAEPTRSAGAFSVEVQKQETRMTPGLGPWENAWVVVASIPMGT